MKKKVFLSLMAVVPLFVLSCAKSAVMEMETQAPVAKPEIGVFIPLETTFVGNGDESAIACNITTKSHTELNGAGDYAGVAWTAGDKIKMFDSEGYYTTYEASASGAEVDFTGGVTLPSAGPYESIYPSTAFLSWGQVNTGSGYIFVFRVRVPFEQTATAGSVAEGANLSYAKTENQGDKMHFRNFVSLLKFRLSGSIVGSVKSVTFKGYDDVAGDMALYPTTEGVPEILNGVFFSTDVKSHSVTLTAEDYFVAGQDYYIALVPGVQDGFIMTFENEDGTKYVKKISSKKITFNRSRVVDFGTINLGSEWDTPSPAPVLEPYIKAQTTAYATIAVIPDGYTESELEQYELDAQAGIEALFATEPYKSYRDHFNVWILKVASNESGARISDGTEAEQNRDCYFRSTWGFDSYDNMAAHEGRVFDFVQENCPDIINEKHTIDEVPVLLIINDPRYGGIAHNYSSGKTYCMTPKVYNNGAPLGWPYPSYEASDVTATPWDYHVVTDEERAALGFNYNGDWRNILVHEFGGHSIGKLGDEYWYDSTYGPTDEISTHSWSVPMSLNVSAKSAQNQVPWKELFDSSIQTEMADKMTLLGKPNVYAQRIGVFQGADVSMYYRWRSEKISCMIDNRYYFSTWQRYILVNRFLKLAGATDNFSMSVSDFLDNDVPFDPLRDNLGGGSPVMQAEGVKFLPPRIMPMLPPPVMHNDE